MIQRSRHRRKAEEVDELESPRKRKARRPWWHFAVPAGVAALGVVVGLCLWLQSGLRPTIEVVVTYAPVKAGDKLLATAVLGDRFTVLDSRNDWYQVRAWVGTEKQLGWIRASDVRQIETGRGKPQEAVEVQLTGVDYPDVVARRPKPYGQRWLFVDVTVRPLEAEADGAYPIQTNRFRISNSLVRVGLLRFANPQYCKTTTVGREQKQKLLGNDVVRVPKDTSVPMSLVFAVPSALLTREGWSVRYVPLPPGSIPMATPAPPTTSTPSAAPKGGTALPAEK
jgi:hypothetical protein